MSGNYVLGGFGGLQGLNRFHDTRFEDLIKRRGWVSVLWEKATKCPCYSEDTGNPTLNCPLCGGIGYNYSEDLEIEVVNEQLEIVSAGQSTFTLKCSLDGTPDSTRTILRVSRAWNATKSVSYTATIVVGLPQVVLSGAALPDPGDKVYVDYVFNRDAGATIRAIITNVDYQRDYIPSGEWLQGDSIMTVSGQFKMAFRDRITIPEQVIRTDELKRRFEVNVKGASLERLRYKTGIKFLLCRDLYRTFELGTDFTLETDQTIVWSPTGAHPTHRAFSLKYTGNATSATMVVTPTALTVTLVGQTDGSTSLSIPFSTYPTVSDVISFISTKAKYVVVQDAQSSIAGVNGEERMTYSIPDAGTSIKNTAVFVLNEDKTQYTVEYMHYMAYSVYMRQGMVRRHDSGTVLPGKYWLRLWEHTDLFSNKHGS